MLVRTNPGQTQLTFTPRLAPSRRSERDSPTTARLAVLYGALPATGKNAADDEVFTMWPNPCLTMIG
jgi:hypothetical protein